MNRSVLLAVLGIGGAGALYYIMANRDTTPVGLTATEFIGGESLGKEGEDSFKVDLVLGSFRASESSISIFSEDRENPLLIVYKNGVPVDGRVVNINNWMLGDDASNEDRIRVMKSYISLKKEFGLDVQEDENNLSSLESVEEPVMDNAQTQNAENMLFGHIGLNALQSNHSW